MKLRLMTVHAHPDDESSKGAATLARYAAEGVDVLVVTCTGGERGRVLNPRMDRPEVAANLAAVRRQEMAAAREILGVRQRFLGFEDSGLPEDPAEPLPDGFFARDWFEALHDAMISRGIESAIGPLLADWPADAPELKITTRIECAEYFETRDRALLAHATQVDPDHPLFAHPRDLKREVWPTEDYELARSLVETESPEDDLFAGIRTN